MKFKKVTHVIFDMDGLLLDTEIVYDKILTNIASQFGKEFSMEVKKKLLGTNEKDLARIAVKELNLPITTETFLKVFLEQERKTIGNARIMPGARQLVKHLYKNDVPIAVATSSDEHIMELKTQHLKDVFNMFSHVVCGNSDPEVKVGKPGPDIFLVCASRFPDKPSPSQCLVIEDAPNGVRGAVSAGMQAVWVPAEDVENVSPEIAKQAVLVLNSLTDFKPELFGLPPFEHCCLNKC